MRLLVLFICCASAPVFGQNAMFKHAIDDLKGGSPSRQSLLVINHVAFAQTAFVMSRLGEGNFGTGFNPLPYTTQARIKVSRLQQSGAQSQVIRDEAKKRIYALIGEHQMLDKIFQLQSRSENIRLFRRPVKFTIYSDSIAGWGPRCNLQFGENTKMVVAASHAEGNNVFYGSLRWNPHFYYLRKRRK